MAYVKKFGKDYYHNRNHVRTKNGAVAAGKGKVRPHHKAGRRAQNKVKNGKMFTKHDAKQAEINRIHNTPNRYQTEAKKVGESPDGCTEVYEWIEDNGHADHVQKRVCHRVKDDDRRPWTMTSPSKAYKSNYDDIFGKSKKRGVAVGHTHEKKVYK